MQLHHVDHGYTELTIVRIYSITYFLYSTFVPRSYFNTINWNRENITHVSSAFTKKKIVVLHTFCFFFSVIHVKEIFHCMPPENNTKPKCFLIILCGYRNETLTQNRLKFIFTFSHSNQNLVTSFSFYFVILWQICQLNIKIRYNLIQLFLCNRKRNKNGSLHRSSHSEVFLGKGVLKICSQFAGEYPCRSAFSINLPCNFIETALQQGCSALNLLYVFRTPFLNNTTGRLLLPPIC